MRSSHVARVIASHHGLLLCVSIPHSQACHCAELDGGFNVSVKKNDSLGLDMDLREISTGGWRNLHEESSIISNAHQISLHQVG
jgi:hypothetical protein